MKVKRNKRIIRAVRNEMNEVEWGGPRFQLHSKQIVFAGGVFLIQVSLDMQAICGTVVVAPIPRLGCFIEAMNNIKPDEFGKPTDNPVFKCRYP